MVSLTIKLPPELKVRLEADARIAGKSASALVREALLAQTTRPSRTSLYDRTRDLCGVGDSGVADLATHPRHLKEFGA